MLPNFVDADPGITLEKLKSNLQNDLNINVFITTIFRCLKVFILVPFFIMLNHLFQNV